MSHVKYGPSCGQMWVFYIVQGMLDKCSLSVLLLNSCSFVLRSVIYVPLEGGVVHTIFVHLLENTNTDGLVFLAPKGVYIPFHLALGIFCIVTVCRDD
jgi:hypothetical protein